MYVDASSSCNDLVFSLGTAADAGMANRMWSIKVNAKFNAKVPKMQLYEMYYVHRSVNTVVASPTLLPLVALSGSLEEKQALWRHTTSMTGVEGSWPIKTTTSVFGKYLFVLLQDI